jgi:L-ribulose-5-phosphate 3-epimerase
MNLNTKKKKYLLNKIGIMQGRLSPVVNNKIQCFPYKYWKNEFHLCNKINVKKLEWTIDNYKFDSNPICTREGREKIIFLKNKWKIEIDSVTADFFMQKPFFKKNYNKEINYDKLKNFIINASKIGIKYIVLPLVDNASVNNLVEEKCLTKLLCNLKMLIKSCNITMLFESDYPPIKLLKFIKKFDKKLFGINYDSGNSAGLGYDFNDEKIYFSYVKNIHIKDKKLNGYSVNLGDGNYEFKKLFKYLKKSNYKGNLILQTARHKNNIYITKKNINFLHNTLVNLKF